MEKAAQTAAERHFLMLQVYFWVFFQHGLKTCYGENEEYKEWLCLIVSVPLLPHWFITVAFKYHLFRHINFQNNADCESFGLFKRYVCHQCVKSTKPRYLSFFKQDQVTINGTKKLFQIRQKSNKS